MFDLYKDLILDHGANPRNKYVMSSYTNYAKGFNHLCGDFFELYLNLVDDCIEKISFNGSGCAISVASASLMTVILSKKTISESQALFERFHSLVISGCDNSNVDDLCVLANVRKFPSRIKCAMLIWHTFNHAIKINDI